MKKYVMVDIEADGQCPGLFSMVQLGAVIVEPGLKRTFLAKFKPLPNASYDLDALNSCDLTRDETLFYPEPRLGMFDFSRWLLENKADVRDGWMFISDNNGFDWQFINYYFHRFVGENPFGHSSTNLGSLYKGLEKNLYKNFKHLRKTKHTHNPVDDAMGNAEAFIMMSKQLTGGKIV